MSEFYVYAQSSQLPNYENCKLVKAGSLVPGIFSKVFGPDSEATCRSWIAKHCIKLNSSSAPPNLGDEDVVYRDDELFVTTTVNAFSISSNPVFENAILPRNCLISRELTIPPSEVIEIFSNGEPGTRVSQRLTFIGGGGHAHDINSTDSRATGVITPETFTLNAPYPQNFKSSYVCGEVSGDILVEQTAVDPFGNTYLATCTFRLGISGLQRLTSSPAISLVGKTSKHPDNHYGTTDMCAKISALAAAFHSKFNKPIFVNDMSLSSGGLFDINGGFTTPHSTHRLGTNVDINYSSMCDDERKFFQSEGERLGFRVVAHGSPVHWHLTLI